MSRQHQRGVVSVLRHHSVLAPLADSLGFTEPCSSACCLGPRCWRARPAPRASASALAASAFRVCRRSSAARFVGPAVTTTSPAPPPRQRRLAASRPVDCRGRSVTVTGNNQRLTLTGSCAAVHRQRQPQHASGEPGRLHQHSGQRQPRDLGIGHQRRKTAAAALGQRQRGEQFPQGRRPARAVRPKPTAAPKPAAPPRTATRL